jgi:hypothetical protein
MDELKRAFEDICIEHILNAKEGLSSIDDIARSLGYKDRRVDSLTVQLVIACYGNLRVLRSWVEAYEESSGNRVEFENDPDFNLTELIDRTEEYLSGLGQAYISLNEKSKTPKS